MQPVHIAKIITKFNKPELAVLYVEVIIQYKYKSLEQVCLHIEVLFKNRYARPPDYCTDAWYM